MSDHAVVSRDEWLEARPELLAAEKGPTRHGDYRSGARVVCSSDAGVAPAKPHDVLPHGVVDGDPLTDLSALHDVVAVYARGKLV